MLSIQAVRGLPRLRTPGIVPRIISFSTQLPCFLIIAGFNAKVQRNLGLDFRNKTAQNFNQFTA